MYRRILVPLDGSPFSEVALGHLGRFGGAQGAEYILLRVEESPPFDFRNPVHESSLGIARGYLGRICSTLASKGWSVRPVLECGSPARAIVDVAGREDASLIVMSTHGRAGWERSYFGSVTEEVIRTSPVPVVAVRGLSCPSGGPIRTVLAPVDGSDRALAVLPHLLALGTGLGARIVLLHVASDEVRAEDSIRAVEQLHALGEALAGSGVHAATLLEEGDPEEVILSVTDAYPADMIAMATHGRTGAMNVALGSVTEAVLRRASVPLFVARARKAGEVEADRETVGPEVVRHA